MRSIALLTKLLDERCSEIVALLGEEKCFVVRNLDELAATGADVLLSYNHAMIVPGDLLRRFVGAYNAHGASPDFPGRDPCHWAVFERATRFGATLHVLAEKVDTGPIVGVDMFDIPENAKPADLLRAGHEGVLRLVARHAHQLRSGELPRGDPKLHWGVKKKSRADFNRACLIEATISAEDLRHRFTSFDGGTHDNLVVELHGFRFRIDKR